MTSYESAHPLRGERFMAEGLGIEPRRHLAASQFSKLVPYHSAQPSLRFGLTAGRASGTDAARPVPAYRE